MRYSNAFTAAHRFPAIDMAAAFLGFIKGPAGMEGRLVGVGSTITVDTTTTATIFVIGNSVDPNEYGTHTVPIGVAEVSQNVLVRGVSERIPADTQVEVAGNAGAAAGDGDVIVYIEWY